MQKFSLEHVHYQHYNTTIVHKGSFLCHLELLTRLISYKAMHLCINWRKSFIPLIRSLPISLVFEAQFTFFVFTFCELLSVHSYLLRQPLPILSFVHILCKHSSFKTKQSRQHSNCWQSTYSVGSFLYPSMCLQRANFDAILLALLHHKHSYITQCVFFSLRNDDCWLMKVTHPAVCAPLSPRKPAQLRRLGVRMLGKKLTEPIFAVKYKLSAN